jgi:hypothetical protein
MPQLRQLVKSLVPWGPGFDLSSVSPCVICSEQSGSARDFSLSTLVFPCQ